MITEAEDKFERIRKTAGLFLAPTVFLIIYLLPLPSLNTESHKLLGVVAFTVICWLTECIPIPVAALLGPTLAVIFGVSDVKSVYAPFSDPIIILLLGSFIIAKAMSAQGLDRRLAFEILSIKSISLKSTSVSLGVGITVALLSMWVSNSAATAMMLPITLGILSALGSVLAKTGEKGIGNQGYATGMLLLVAYAASIGGISTPVGTPPNLITLGMLENIEGIKIDFLRWMAIGIPITLVMLLFVWLYMSVSCPSVVKELKGFHSFIYNEKKRLGKWKRGEINVLIAFGVAVVLWVTPGFISIIFGSESEVYKTYNKSLPESVVALIAASMLFILPTNWKEREFTLTLRKAMDIDWGTLLLFGGGLSLGSMMFKTGLAETIGKNLINLTGADSLISITALGLFLAVILSETTSNTATANMLIPLIIAISTSAGISPLPPAIAVGIGSSFGFMLPVSTPPNAIVYGSGLIPVTKMIKYGFVVDVVGYFVVLAGVLILCPLVGLE